MPNVLLGQGTMLALPMQPHLVALVLGPGIQGWLGSVALGYIAVAMLLLVPDKLGKHGVLSRSQERQPPFKVEPVKLPHPLVHHGQRLSPLELIVVPLLHLDPGLEGLVVMILWNDAVAVLGIILDDRATHSGA